AITGEMSGAEIHGADFHIKTCEQEVSFAYTKSYSTALCALAILCLRVAARKSEGKAARDPREVDSIPVLIRRALSSEAEIRKIAKAVARMERIVLFGAGVGWPTAREGALKIKESCYIAAEGFETEEVLHGPFSEIDSRAALVGLLTGWATDERARQILRAAGELKTQRIAVATPSANHDISAEHILQVPEARATEAGAIGEWLAVFRQVVPLQLLNYYIALERGLNPDTGRQDQAAHAAASRHYKY